jgi:hypothetical protein
VAVVGIVHMNKIEQRKALYRALGSVAFVAAARVVFAIGTDKDDTDRRIMVAVKSNLAAMAAALAFRIDATGKLNWGGRLQMSMRTLFYPPHRRKTARSAPTRGKRFSNIWRPRRNQSKRRSFMRLSREGG